MEQILFVLQLNCKKFLLGDDVNDSISADSISRNSRAPQVRKKAFQSQFLAGFWWPLRLFSLLLLLPSHWPKHFVYP